MKKIILLALWIPEGRTWGCVHVERKYMADRGTIEALVEEIKELKQRISDLEAGQN